MDPATLPAIETHGLGKRYRIRREQETGGPLLTRAKRLALAPFEHLNRMIFEGSEEDGHWAMRDLDLQIHPGEIVALIGRNGAGKTTMLKLIARLTTPTQGHAIVRGRVASMLELGTGFHPDLTGRENIFVNGQIMGMTRAEIRARFDEIVAFAGIEKYLDTIVRFYSSGMYVRLAMGVSVHLSAEILLVDEVLSVVDAAFREKSLAKIREIAVAGRTVLFVSHNINSILQLCTRALLLDNGSVVDDGPAPEIVRKYLAGTLDISAERTWEPVVAPCFRDNDPDADASVQLRGVRALNAAGAVTEVFDVRDPVTVEVDLDVLERKHAVAVVCGFEDDLGRTMFVATHDRGEDAKLEPGRHRLRAMVPGDLLNEGRVRVSIRVETRPVDFALTAGQAIAIEITDRGDPAGVRGDWPGSWPEAMLRPRVPWDVDESTPLDR